MCNKNHPIFFEKNLLYNNQHEENLKIDKFRE